MENLWQFKTDEVSADNADLTADNSQSFKYKAALVGKRADAVNNRNSSVKSTKIVVPSRYLNNFWRLSEKSLINCKIHLELNWVEDCMISSAGDSAKFKIMDVNIHFLIVTLSTEDNVNLRKQLSDGFQGFVYWNNYQTIPVKEIIHRISIYELPSASYQAVEWSFVFACVIAANADNNKAGIKDKKKYFLPRGKIENCKALTDKRNVYDQPISDL